MNASNNWKPDCEHLWHPFTRMSDVRGAPLPLIVKGQGIYLISADGRRFVDAISSWWSCALGHGHPRIVEAIRSQATELQHSILAGLSHPRAVELASEIAGLFSNPRRHVLFASDGASAVEAALKIAAQYWHNSGSKKRTRFAALENAYHGDTLGAVAVGYIEGFHNAFRALLNPATTLPVPSRGMSEETCRRQAEALFAQQGESLAALIVEPLCLGAAGMRMYPASYLSFLADLCKRHGVLLIVDEIATGFGRTGRWFAFEHAMIDPDIVCLGKALTAGSLPMSATVVKDEIYESFSDTPVDHTFYHGHTFCGNPIAAAAALTAIRIYKEENIPEKALQIQDTFSRALSPLSRLSHVSDVRWLGAIGAVELAGPASVEMAAQEDSVPAAQRIRRLLFEQGILVRPLGNVVYLFPPLNISQDELDRLLAAFVDAVRRAAS